LHLLVECRKNNKSIWVKSDLSQNIGRLCLSAGLLFSPLAVGAEVQTEITNSGSLSAPSLTLGTPASFLSSLKVGQARHSLAVPSTFSLVNHLGEEINVIADNFSVGNDGTLSMNGHAKDIDNVEFILQGNDDNVYGWVILKDQNVAYEYTTKNGILVVDEIAITDVHPNCDFEKHELSTLLPQAFRCLMSMSPLTEMYTTKPLQASAEVGLCILKVAVLLVLLLLVPQHFVRYTKKLTLTVKGNCGS
jgi:hypothetical protein